MTDNVNISAADIGDQDVILQFWQSLTIELPSHHFQPFGVPLEAERFQQLEMTLKQSLQSERCIVLKADMNGEVCATISAVLNTLLGFSKAESSVLFNLWVDEQYRQSGIATRLVKAAKRWLKEQGAESVQVGWHPENQAADHFWKKQGFRNYEVIAALLL